jgi:hypothetical protein
MNWCWRRQIIPVRHWHCIWDMAARQTTPFSHTDPRLNHGLHNPTSQCIRSSKISPHVINSFILHVPFHPPCLLSRQRAVMAISVSGALRGRNKTEKNNDRKGLTMTTRRHRRSVALCRSQLMPSSLSLPQVLLRHTADANLRRSKACFRTKRFSDLRPQPIQPTVLLPSR